MGLLRIGHSCSRIAMRENQHRSMCESWGVGSYTYSVTIGEIGNVGVVCSIGHRNARLAITDAQPNIRHKGIASCNAALKAICIDLRKIIVEVRDTTGNVIDIVLAVGVDIVTIISKLFAKLAKSVGQVEGLHNRTGHGITGSNEVGSVEPPVPPPDTPVGEEPLPAVVDPAPAPAPPAEVDPAPPAPPPAAPVGEEPPETDPAPPAPPSATPVGEEPPADPSAVVEVCGTKEIAMLSGDTAKLASFALSKGELPYTSESTANLRKQFAPLSISSVKVTATHFLPP